MGANVICTEQPSSVENLRRCVQGTKIEVRPLLWGEMSYLETLPPIDIIVGSEIIYDADFHDHLIKTLVELFSRNPMAVYYNVSFGE
ncbi:hypothetical protein BVRB_041250 [Beta vulgaris subsp. vulgaris]|uniref:Uncharacterized protein n=1 Tax=Beta vulgaris subsp. vulgaris TaxID=3555 RepID=A0A0J7YP63_BETVV|nr:hypothetical protein BVRB_041250 [Beta vulgaris subsp. vulgaris]